MDKKKMSDLFKVLKASEAMTHGWHLQTDSYAKHMALGNYYETLLGLTDGLVETWQGRHNDRISLPTNLTLLSISQTDQHFSDMKKVISSAIEELDGTTFLEIQDKLIDIMNLLDKTTYLLTLS